MEGKEGIVRCLGSEFLCLLRNACTLLGCGRDQSMRLTGVINVRLAVTRLVTSFNRGCLRIGSFNGRTIADFTFRANSLPLSFLRRDIVGILFNELDVV